MEGMNGIHLTVLIVMFWLAIDLSVKHLRRQASIKTNIVRFKILHYQIIILK